MKSMKQSHDRSSMASPALVKRWNSVISPTPHRDSSRRNKPINGRHTVSLTTPMTSPSPLLLPPIGLVRESTNLSQTSHYSEASSPGPLTRQRTSLKQHVRGKTRGGTRYVMNFNDYLFKVQREDGGRISPRRSASRNSIPEQIKYGFSARPTASGLTDPWVDLNMDNSVLPKIQDRLVTHAEPSSPRSVKKFRKKKDVLEGSTMLPKFPVIEMPNSEYVNRALYYNELHGIRDQLDKRKMYNRRQNREDVDYKRTKQDFYRMELDKIHDFDEIKQTRMRDMYYSYLQNTPGSSKAVKECVKKIG